MKYLLVAIINTIYGVLLLLTLSTDMPGFFLVLTIGSVLTILGLVGFILWIRMVINVNKDVNISDTAIKSWFGLIKSFDIVLIIGLLFRAIIIQPFVVDGSSMENNFHDRQILLVDKITFRFTEPQRGDVVIFKAPRNPRDDYIKRIIAYPGETIIITQGKVFINGYLLDEPYLAKNTQTEVGSETIFRKTMQPNEYFVMGDNRDNSSDSREWGALPRINIIGQAWMSVYPWINKGLIKNPAPKIEKNILLKNFTFYNTVNAI